MGNSISVENDLFVAQKNLCGNSINNDHVAYITNQYITLIKAKNILENVIEKLEKAKDPDGIQYPCKLVFPLDKILADYANNKPIPTSVQIFGDEVIIETSKEGKQITSYNTVLHEYNSFFITYDKPKTTSDSEKVARAKGLIVRLNDASDNALSILLSNCNSQGAGLTCGEQEQQQKQ